MPPVAAVLQAREVPATGGDTLWSNQYLAYAGLSDRTREELAMARAVHTSRLAFNGYGGNGQVIATEHPLAPRHPWTDKRYLYANPVSTDRLAGKSPEESAELLGFLFTHAIRDAFRYRHRWRVGDIVVWDNRATMHMALNDYHGQRRVMHRVSVSEADGG
jgi:taurine dioxygenase